MIGFDEFFSTWILVWYILYMIGIIHFSPKYWIIILLVATVCLTFYIKIKMSIIVLGIFGIFILKLIPLYTIRNDSLKIYDLLFGLLLVVFYIVWMQYKNIDIVNTYTVRISNEQGPITRYIMTALNLKD
jgi:hypothetical protein